MNPRIRRPETILQKSLAHIQESIQPYLQIKNNTDNYFFAFAAEGEIRLKGS